MFFFLETFKIRKRFLVLVGVLNKLKFWKREEDDFDFDKITQKELGLGELFKISFRA